MELEDAAVRDRMEGRFAHVTVQRPHRSAVSHDEDPPSGIRARDALDRRQNAGGVLLARLAVRALAAEPLVDLVARQTRPRADVDLAQPGVGNDVEAVR